MAIELFKHNQDVYTAAVKMLQTTGKAAVMSEQKARLNGKPTGRS